MTSRDAFKRETFWDLIIQDVFGVKNLCITKFRNVTNPEVLTKNPLADIHKD